jgi:hypothetical protein
MIPDGSLKEAISRKMKERENKLRSAMHNPEPFV